MGIWSERLCAGVVVQEEQDLECQYRELKERHETEQRVHGQLINYLRNQHKVHTPHTHPVSTAVHTHVFLVVNNTRGAGLEVRKLDVLTPVLVSWCGLLVGAL